MFNVELKIAELAKTEDWRQINLVAVPRAGDLISLDIREGDETHGRYVRVDVVLFVANPPEVGNHNPVVLHATLLGPEETNLLGLA